MNLFNKICKILAVIIGLAGVVMFVTSLMHSPKMQNDVKKGVNRVVNYKNISLKADDLLDEYIQDSSNTKEKYYKQPMEITGKVTSKGQFANTKDYYLVLSNKRTADKKYSLILRIEDDKINIINEVKEGDFIKAEGVYVGAITQKDPNYIVLQVDIDSITK